MQWFTRVFSKRHVGLCMIICIFMTLLLAGKNPFDDQSLIPNLEPYPDSLYYSYPAWNVAHGGDFSMTYHDTTVKNVTPPLFSLYLLPFFAVVKDVRVFYFAQLALLVVSIVLLTKALQLVLDHSKESPFIKSVMIFFAIFLFITNFYIYTMPSLLMAELLSITIVLAGCVLLLLPNTPIRAAISAHIGVLLLLIKVSNLPLTAVFYLLFLMKVWKPSENKTFFVHAITAMLYTTAFFYGSQFFEGHKNIQGGSNFSFENAQRNLPFYLRAAAGFPTRYLWYTERFVSPLVSLGALFGLCVGSMMKSTRQTVAAILLGASGLVLFMAFFVTPDARYISALIPLYSILCLIGFMWIYSKMKTEYFLMFVCVVLIIYLLLPTFSYQPGEPYMISMKKQIGLNYLHPENPWNYTAVVSMDTFSASQKSEKPIYIATFLPEFYVGMFAKNFVALPVTTQQEFYSAADDKKIEHMYDQAFLSGKVYLSNAYVGNVRDVWPSEFERIKEKYDGKLVYEGCLGTCNLYLLTMPSQ